MAKDHKWWFEDDGKELVISDPQTPLPWENYLANDRARLAVDQRGQGISMATEPDRIFPLTRDYRYFFLRDDDTGEHEPLAAAPAQQGPDGYRCVHGTGWTRIECRLLQGLAARVEVVLPVRGTGEFWTMSVSNDSQRPRNLSLFHVVGLAYNRGRGTEGRWDEEHQLLLHHNPIGMSQLQKQLRRLESARKYCYMTSDVRPDSWDLSEPRFFGGQEHHRPLAVQQGRCSSLAARAVPMCAAMHWKLSIAAGETREVRVYLDAAATVEEAAARRKDVMSAEQFRQVRRAVDEHWDTVLSQSQVQTPDADLDMFCNVLAKRQVMLMADTDRLGYVVITSRNLLQDLLGLGLIDPGRAWRKFLSVLKYQEASGFLQRGWNSDGSPSRTQMNLLNFRDGGVWATMVGAVLAGWQESLEVLDEPVRFRDTDESASVYEHIVRPVESLAKDTGHHGLILLGEGDWNDALNDAGSGGKGESQMLTATLIYAIKLLSPIMRERGDLKRLEKLEDAASRLAQAINDRCWDGEWFVRGFADDGEPFGCSKDQEGTIWLNAQSWPVLAGIVSPERTEQVFRSIARHLDQPPGPALLVPAFSRPDPRIGAVTTRLRGGRVNGSIYNHAAMFTAAAACAAGRGERAWRYLAQALPTNPQNPPERNLQPPTYFPNYYTGPIEDENLGISSRNISTGTPAWFLWVVHEHLLGVRATVDGLRIDPCVPPSWREFSQRRTFRGAVYEISFSNPRGVAGGVQSVTVDGRPLDGNLVPTVNDGKVHKVDVVMG